MEKSDNVKNIFCHESSDIKEAFTELWVQLINEEESESSILQTNISGL